MPSIVTPLLMSKQPAVMWSLAVRPPTRQKAWALAWESGTVYSTVTSLPLTPVTWPVATEVPASEPLPPSLVPTT